MTEESAKPDSVGLLPAERRTIEDSIYFTSNTLASCGYTK
jgi:hypothetical protein